MEERIETIAKKMLEQKIDKKNNSRFNRNDIRRNRKVKLKMGDLIVHF